MIKPVKRTFMAAVLAKKTVLAGIESRKFNSDCDIAKSPIIVKIENTRHVRVNSVSAFDESECSTHQKTPRI